MRKFTLWRSLPAMVAASLLLLNGSSAFAQGAGQGQGQGRRGGGGAGGGAAFQNATDEQREALRAMNEEIRDHTQKVRTARTDLNGAIYAAKTDEADIKAKAAALAKAEEEQALARAKAFGKIRSKLTAEQIDALKSAQGGGGFGGGGRGGAGGGRRNNNN